MGIGRAASFAEDVRRCLSVWHRLPLFAALVALAVVNRPVTALASPKWGIAMTHANAYGLQASSCPGGHESLPGEAACGVDPNTGSGTTFVQESGFNAYIIHVKNASSTGLGAGTTLKCEPGTWQEGPTFSYHWLRNGTLIGGAEAAEYTVTAEDAGKAVQCQVTGTNVSGAANTVTKAAVVEPPPAAEPPTSTSLPTVAKESTTVPVGVTLTCLSGSWTDTPTFVYQWLRNGVAIPGAASASHTTTDADLGNSLQCQVTATNAGGAVVADNTFFTYIGEAEPSPYPPYSATEPTIPSTSEITGPVTVTDHLPSGLVFAAGGAVTAGSGWEGGSGEGNCEGEGGGTNVTCRTSKPLAPGESYAPITVHVRATGEAPAAGVTNTAAVGGGGASASVSDLTTIAPATPFGIQSFTTSLTDPLDGPFTQAGGHPFAANATFVLNFDTNGGGGLETAGGTTKDVETELPPGFIGDPQNAPRCTAAEIQPPPGGGAEACPSGSVVGFVTVELNGSIAGGEARPFASASSETSLVYNLEPPPEKAAAFGFFAEHAFFALNATLRGNGDYGVTIGDNAGGRAANHGVLAVSLTLCSYGVTGHPSEPGAGLPSTATCDAPTSGVKPFLTAPTECSGRAHTTTLKASTYQDPGDSVSTTVYNGTGLVGGVPSATESFVTGCKQLQFWPEVGFGPNSPPEGGTSQADEPSGAVFNLKVPQTNEAGVDATPQLKNAKVTLPEGVTIDPSAADGLLACSNAQFGLGSTAEPAESASCPLASQIGTVRVVTPLLETPLEGQIFIGEPECSPCSASDAEAGDIFRLFLQIRSPERGVVVKLAGRVSASPTTGQLQATFTEQPQLPFSELLLTFTGGARASLANPQTCGTYTTTTDLTPWSTSGVGGLSGLEAIAGTPDASPSSSFNVDWNGAGGTCPGSLPFSPSFSAGGQTPTAGTSSPFSVTIGREDREQDISGITVTTPPGLLGEVSQVSRCPEPQANAGTCHPESLIGSTTVGAGPGPHPLYLPGKVYLTGPYNGQPFGLSVVVPAVAGPFNLGTVVVRASIAVNPTTGELTIAANSLPQFVDGVQLRLRRINVEVNRPGFMVDPTSCAQHTVTATITAAQGASSTASSSFEVGGCQSLPFAPSFTVSTQGAASFNGNGASLDVKVAQKQGEANIAKVDVQLPKVLPSRQSTLKQACTQAQFAANPAGCPEGSDVGTAVARTPILNNALEGPAYLVSHGGAAFPDLEVVLQGEGITLILDGGTEIHNGVTFSRFDTVPDAPISSFELNLPEGPHSVLAVPAATHGSLCGQKIVMPTTITGQNGAQIVQKTSVAVTGCAASKPEMKTKLLTRAQKLAKALRTCRKVTNKRKRRACERTARQRYAVRAAKKPKTAKINRRGN